jgi:hypothetical protein
MGQTGDGTATNAIDALRALHDHGFGGSPVHDDHGLAALRYRHHWDGVTDVVLVHDVNDAEAYRADDSLGQAEFPSSSPGRREAAGSVVEVVTAVLDWPAPETQPAGPPRPAATSDTGESDTC